MGTITTKIKSFLKPRKSQTLSKMKMKEKYHFIMILLMTIFGLTLYLVFSSPLLITIMSCLAFGLVFYSSVKKSEYSKIVKEEAANEYEISARLELQKNIDIEVINENKTEDAYKNESNYKKELIKSIREKRALKNNNGVSA